MNRMTVMNLNTTDNLDEHKISRIKTIMNNESRINSTNNVNELNQMNIEYLNEIYCVHKS